MTDLDGCGHIPQYALGKGMLGMPLGRNAVTVNI